jgi:hypothetical protein
MAATQTPFLFLDEVVELLTSGPSRDRLLNYRPSEKVQQRARDLLMKVKSGEVTRDEEWELDQFQQLEMLLQLVKARLRTTSVAGDPR